MIAQTLIICLITWLFSSTAWVSFILFLIFIGGLIVLFIYITRLAANEKINISPRLTKKQLIIIIYRTIILITITWFYPTKMYAPSPLSNQVEIIFSQLLSPITIIIIIYLLITLIVAVKISKKLEGPLRNIMKRK